MSVHSAKTPLSDFRAEPWAVVPWNSMYSLSHIHLRFSELRCPERTPTCRFHEATQKDAAFWPGFTAFPNALQSFVNSRGCSLFSCLT